MRAVFLMRFGLFFAFQVIPARGASLAEPYQDLLECLPRAEELGYESIFTASHHVQPDGWCPVRCFRSRRRRR